MKRVNRQFPGPDVTRNPCKYLRNRRCLWTLFFGEYSRLGYSWAYSWPTSIRGVSILRRTVSILKTCFFFSVTRMHTFATKKLCRATQMECITFWPKQRAASVSSIIPVGPAYASKGYVTTRSMSPQRCRWLPNFDRTVRVMAPCPGPGSRAPVARDFVWASLAA